MRKRKRAEEVQGTSVPPQGAGNTPADGEGRDQVARRAYDLYQARGGGDGQAVEDWLQAEEELSPGRQKPDSR